MLGRLCIEGISFPLHYGKGIDRAFAHTCCKTVTVIIGHQFCLAVYKLYGAFCAGFHTLSTAVAFFLIYLDYLSLQLHGISPVISKVAKSKAQRKAIRTLCATLHALRVLS